MIISEEEQGNEVICCSLADLSVPVSDIPSTLLIWDLKPQSFLALNSIILQEKLANQMRSSWEKIHDVERNLKNMAKELMLGW